MGEALSKSLSLLTSYPILFIPQAITFTFSLVTSVLFFLSPLNPLSLLISIGSLVVAIIVSGAYPFLVKSIVEGGQPSIGDSFAKGFHRFWSLLGAGLLVGIIVAIGFIALIVPGIILLTWYVYTVPAIMLEDKGVLDGMAASKNFGHDKKWSSFLMFLAIIAGYIVVYVVLALFTLSMSTLIVTFVDDLLLVPIGAWIAVLISYVYIAYGPTSVPATPPITVYAPPPMGNVMQPGVIGTTQPGNFCPSCGSPVVPGAKFCRNCGKPL